MSFGGFVKRSIYWANDYIHGGAVRAFYKDMENVLSDEKTGRKIQQEHLRNLLEHSTANSPYYCKIGGVTLNDFPVVNKNILNENRDEVCVPVEKIPWQDGKALHIQRTSGSTGTPFAVPQDTRKRSRRVAELKYYNELVGFKSHEKLAQCRIWTKWHSKSKWQSFKENIIPVNISTMDDKTTENLIKTVKANRVVAIRAYASWYDALVEYLKSGKGNVSDLKSLKVCISISEALNETTREMMKELTGVPIVEAYADEEAGMLAQQLVGDNNYYLNHSGYIFEFLKLDEDVPAEPGELARIVITDLFNYAFPLIRYDTGDTAVYQNGNGQSCGWPYISKLYGRRLDLVYDTRGIPVHPMNFARVLKNLPGIIQWQFVQKGERQYLVRLNLEDKSNVEDKISEIRGILGEDAEISVEFVNDIPVLASGKRKPVVCEWKK